MLAGFELKKTCILTHYKIFCLYFHKYEDTFSPNQLNLSILVYTCRNTWSSGCFWRPSNDYIVCATMISCSSVNLKICSIKQCPKKGGRGSARWNMLHWTFQETPEKIIYSWQPKCDKYIKIYCPFISFSYKRTPELPSLNHYPHFSWYNQYEYGDCLDIASMWAFLTE